MANNSNYLNDDDTALQQPLAGTLSEVLGEEVQADSAMVIEDAPPANWQRINRYGFRAGTYPLLVPSGVYSELLTECSISRLPNTPDYFLGITNVRGNLVPVYQLEPLLGHAPITPKYVLLIGPLDTCAGLVVAGKPQMLAEDSLVPLALEELDDHSVLPTFLREAITAIVAHEADLWYTLNQQQLFEQLASPHFQVSQLQENHQ